MLPLSLLKAAKGQPILVELRNGETYNGNLVDIDFLMNIVLKDVVCTSRNGDKFWKIAEINVRGSALKYLRVPDQIIEKVHEEEQARAAEHGGDRGRGRGRGRISNATRGSERGASAAASRGRGGANVSERGSSNERGRGRGGRGSDRGRGRSQ